MIKSTDDLLFARIRARMQGRRNCERIRNMHVCTYIHIERDRFSRRKARSHARSSPSSSGGHFVTRARILQYCRIAGSVRHACSSCTRAGTKNALSWYNNDSARRSRGRALTLSPSSGIRCAVKQRRCIAKYLSASRLEQRGCD